MPDCNLGGKENTGLISERGRHPPPATIRQWLHVIAEKPRARPALVPWMTGPSLHSLLCSSSPPFTFICILDSTSTRPLSWSESVYTSKTTPGSATVTIRYLHIDLDFPGTHPALHTLKSTTRLLSGPSVDHANTASYSLTLLTSFDKN